MNRDFKIKSALKFMVVIFYLIMGTHPDCYSQTFSSAPQRKFSIQGIGLGHFYGQAHITTRDFFDSPFSVIQTASVYISRNRMPMNLHYLEFGFFSYSIKETAYFPPSFGFPGGNFDLSWESRKYFLPGKSNNVKLFVGCGLQAQYFKAQMSFRHSSYDITNEKLSLRISFGLRLRISKRLFWEYSLVARPLTLSHNFIIYDYDSIHPEPFNEFRYKAAPYLGVSITFGLLFKPVHSGEN